ncbi:hypothetical protein [Natronomonas marina]|jgi:hypothetical protein|uniref:hypothetical protein n=1 Tax=Natronomonas marina TaxID=2961939 RepID=UPI0020C9B2F5|nr:hypothetical protein [Natronomonas marina]
MTGQSAFAAVALAVPDGPRATGLVDLATAPVAQASGGAPTLVLLVFAALVVATVLSLYLAVRLYRGYTEGGDTGMLVLGAGLVLLTTVPMVLRFVLSNVPGVAPTTQELLATACQLLGLLVILGVIHGRR